jgi:hypothetical protein
VETVLVSSRVGVEILGELSKMVDVWIPFPEKGFVVHIHRYGYTYHTLEE